MKLFTVLKNIWSIKELRDRILFTLALLFVYRLGTFVVLPGVVPAALKSAASNRSANDLLGLINVFTGGAFDKAAIFALGVMPYITASIIVQLLGFAVPYFQRLQKDGDSGRKRLTQITRLLTVAITLVQGGGYLQMVSSIPNAVVSSDVLAPSLFWFTNIIILAAGTIFCMWLGERITDKGIGNGTSLIIQAGIIARLPQAFAFELQKLIGDNKILLLIIEMALFFVVIMLTILVIQGVRKIPLQFAKRSMGRTGNAMPSTTARDHLPLKVNSAGVMPIIFAQALMFIPATVYSYFSGNQAQAGGIQMLSDVFSLGYNVLFFLLIVIFTYVYTALMINPTNYANYLKQSNAFVPGVKPGEATADYIENIMSLITLPGAVFLGIIGILPSIAATLGVNQEFALFFGGTTLLIMVGVALDTLQVIETYLLQDKYDGLIKSGRIQGRSTQGVQVGQPQ
jgi:preprotein translocase subunit SecY